VTSALAASETGGTRNGIPSFRMSSIQVIVNVYGLAVGVSQMSYSAMESCCPKTDRVCDHTPASKV